MLIGLSGINFCPKIKSWETVCRSSPDVWKCKTNISSSSKKSWSGYFSGKLNFFSKKFPWFSSPNTISFALSWLRDCKKPIFYPKHIHEKNVWKDSLVFGSAKPICFTIRIRLVPFWNQQLEIFSNFCDKWIFSWFHEYMHVSLAIFGKTKFKSEGECRKSFIYSFPCIQ